MEPWLFCRPLQAGGRGGSSALGTALQVRRGLLPYPTSWAAPLSLAQQNGDTDVLQQPQDAAAPGYRPLQTTRWCTQGYTLLSSSEQICYVYLTLCSMPLVGLPLLCFLHTGLTHEFPQHAKPSTQSATLTGFSGASRRCSVPLDSPTKPNLALSSPTSLFTPAT